MWLARFERLCSWHTQLFMFPFLTLNREANRNGPLRGPCTSYGTNNKFICFFRILGRVRNNSNTSAFTAARVGYTSVCHAAIREVILSPNWYVDGAQRKKGSKVMLGFFLTGPSFWCPVPNYTFLYKPWFVWLLLGLVFHSLLLFSLRHLR